MPASLRGSRSARSVLLRMAADQDRAERIRKLKSDNPGLTWRAIADHVGVTERAAADWAKSGGIAYDNAKKLAELLEVDPDYIWRGNLNVPDPFVRPASNDDLAGTREEFHARVDYVETLLGDLADRIDRNERLLVAILATIRGTAEAAGFQAPPIRPEAERILLADSSPVRPERKLRGTDSPGRSRRQAG